MFNEYGELKREMELFFDDYPGGVFGRSLYPRVDVYQTDDNVVLKAEMPGLGGRFDVSVSKKSVTLSGSAEKSCEKGHHRSERFSGTFSRTVTLPAEVAPGRAKSRYRDGVLTITAPKIQRRTKGNFVDILILGGSDAFLQF